MRRLVPVFAAGLLFAAAFAPSSLAAQETGGALTVDEALAKKGKSLWTAKACNGCHTIGKGRMAGPDLAHVTDRRSVEWLAKWLSSTSTMLETDEQAKAMLAEYNNTRMPDFKLKDEDAQAIIHHLAKESQKVKKSEK